MESCALTESLRAAETDTPRPKYRILSTSFAGRKGAGCSTENQDRILVRGLRAHHGPRHLLGVADGVSRCPHGGEVAAYVIGKHLALDRLFAPGNVDLSDQLLRYLTRIHTDFYQEFVTEPDMLESACTLSLALIDGSAAHCFWVGDSPIVLSRRKGRKFVPMQISKPDICGRMLIDCFGAHAAFQLKYRAVEMRPGDVLAVGSDGAIHDPKSFGALLDEHGPTETLLEALQETTEEAEYYDDASLVLAERME